MIRRALRKFSPAAATVLFTVFVIVVSLILYFAISFLFPPIEARGIILAIVIPAIVVPLVSYPWVLSIIRLEKSEQSLRESEKRRRLLFDHAGDAIVIIKADAFVDCNEKALRLFGCDRENFIGMTPRDFSCRSQPDGRRAKERALEEISATANGRENSFEWRCKRFDGTEFDAEIVLSSINLADGMHLQAIIRDVSQRKQMEDSLRHSEARYRQLFEHISDAVLITDCNTLKIEDGNRSALTLLGYLKEELSNIGILDLVGDVDNTKKSFDELIRGELDREVAPVLYFKRKDGSMFAAEVSRSVYSTESGSKIICSIRDISDRLKAEEDRRQLETQLRQAQKMESIGTLAGGIAHDFNNILSAIFGFAELVLPSLPEGSEAKDYATEILKAAERARLLIKQLLAFSRQDEQELKPMRIGFLVKEVYKMLRATLPSTIEIKYNVDKDEGVVSVNATQIHQVLLNLCTNAAHAMAATGGQLTMSLSRVNLDEKAAATGPDLQPGSHMRLTIRDTGIGIAPENLERIFDPYFTTKEKGVGTGLGLSVVEGIVKTHRGAVTVESMLGQGSAFHVYMPIVKHMEPPDRLKQHSVETGTEHILFVDDEPILIEVAGKMLSRAGYKVETRASSIEALKLFEADPNRFDLVITDMTMPHLTGDQLAQKMIELRPDIPIILCTGYSELVDESRAEQIGIRAFIMKPLVASEITHAIRKVLDAT